MTSSQPSLSLFCGLPGSGKTTAARQRAAASDSVLLSLDEVLVSAYGPLHIAQEPEARAHRVATARSQVWAQAKKLLEEGRSTVLDDGFFLRASRELCREYFATTRCSVTLFYCTAPNETLIARVQARNENLPPHTHVIPIELLEHMIRSFDPPGIDEAPVVVHSV